MAISADPFIHLRRQTSARGWRTLALLVCVLIGGLVVWGRTVSLDQFVTGEGEVSPSDKVKVIQHLEGGAIAKIFVLDGQAVKAGDPLVEVNLAITGTNRDELAAKQDGLLLSRARLLAEARNEPFNPPAEISQRRPDLAAAELDAFNARKVEL